MNGCTCKYEWKAMVGTHDTVTGEWLPDKPTIHICVAFSDPNCPMHGLADTLRNEVQRYLPDLRDLADS